MSTKSIHLETLEKIQHMLDGFDMSFKLSNKMFRLAIVSEIIDATCMFEQLYKSWGETLPFGEGPDSDVDFDYWQDMSSWSELRTYAQQNVCIVPTGIDMGNGTYSESAEWDKSRKSYSKHLKETIKSSKFADQSTLLKFSKAMNSKDFDITSFGNLVFYSLTHLTGVLRKIQILLDKPTENLLNSYCEKQRERFICEYSKARKRMADILREDLPDRRKFNKLKSFSKELQKNLYDSDLLEELTMGVTEFDVEDYRRDNPDTDFDDAYIKRAIALSELVNDNGSLKPKTNSYLFNNRRHLPSSAVRDFFVYIDLKPVLDNTIATYNTNNEDDRLPATAVSKIQQLTRALQNTPSNVTLNINLIKDANIDKNFGPITYTE